MKNNVILFLGIVLLSSTAFAKAFVLPHVLEKSGVQGSPDVHTELHMTYVSGLRGAKPTAGDAKVELYLYTDTSQPFRSLTGNNVCNPCSYALNSRVRKKSVSFEQAIKEAGGYPIAPEAKLGFGVIVVSGSDPDGVNLQGFVVNSHTSAFDLSVFGFEPQPIIAAP